MTEQTKNKTENGQIRVLHVLGTTNLGGAESRVMELYRSMDRTRVQFDFLVHTDKEGHYSEEIRSLGGKVYHVPRFNVKNYHAYKKALMEFFQSHHDYAAVHGHMTSTASIYLPIAKKAGIPLTIAHARSAGVDRGVKGLVTRVVRLPLKDRADCLFTCSAEAGAAVYGKRAVRQGRVWTIPNAIDTQRFQFNGSVREKIRKELGISDKFVIGHVGRFGFMKNHAYLIDIFSELCKLREDAVLVLIGRGELENEVKQKVEKLGLTKKVHFLGVRSNVEDYYQAFDYFVFPSTFEGLPGSAAEAQAAGLCCLISDKVTREAALTDLAVYRSIDEPPLKWAQNIQENAKKALRRRDTQQEIAAQGFDVRLQAKQMEQFYRTGANPPGHISMQTKNQRIKILLITPMLHQGGFERICAMTAKLLADIYEVHIAVFTKKDMFYDVSGIDLIDLKLPARNGKISKVFNIVKRTARLRALKKSLGIDISYSFGTTANIVNVLSKTKDTTWAGIRGYGALTDSGIGLICKRADRVISCTRTMEADMNQKFAPKASATLYNPCDTAEIKRLASDESGITRKHLAFAKSEGALIASMGREDDLKGFWHLIKSFALMKKALPNARLMIIGDGEYKEYRELAKALDIEASVLFTGVYQNPFALLKYADLYALTSDSEGFPNALLEAMACGVPCISVNCKTGPNEILADDFTKYTDRSKTCEADYGVLTGIFTGEKNLDASIITQEERAFADMVVRLLQDREKLNSYRKGAQKRAENFGMEQYVRQIKELAEL